MKNKSLAIALTLTVIASSVALAADPAKDAKDTKATPEKPKKAQVQQTGQQPKQIEITGSYIKRDIRRDGKITDGPSQVVVLDRDMIDRSGGATIKQVLVHQGIR
jgi:hypothetical protein